jgi:hypothetical protein
MIHTEKPTSTLESMMILAQLVVKRAKVRVAECSQMLAQVLKQRGNTHTRFDCMLYSSMLGSTMTNEIGS